MLCKPRAAQLSTPASSGGRPSGTDRLWNDLFFSPMSQFGGVVIDSVFRQRGELLVIVHQVADQLLVFPARIRKRHRRRFRQPGRRSRGEGRLGVPLTPLVK